MFLSKRTFLTPLGELTGIASSTGLVLLGFAEDLEYYHEKMQKRFPGYRYHSQFCKTLEKTNDWLQSYFAKPFSKMPLPPLDLQGTPFTLQAWKALLEIPAGMTQSYGQLAKSIGYPNACRGVGRAMGENPIAILVPCHRIIGANGKLTGYSSGLSRKEWLLKHESAS